MPTANLAVLVSSRDIHEIVYRWMASSWLKREFTGGTERYHRSAQIRSRLAMNLELRQKVYARLHLRPMHPMRDNSPTAPIHGGLR
jgi:hypothetical protein